MDTLRVVEINHYGNTDCRKAYKVQIQRGSLFPEERSRWLKKFKQRQFTEYGVERPITQASKSRLVELFDGFDGGSRPENVDVEFHMGIYRMDVSFSIDGRLNKDQ